MCDDMSLLMTMVDIDQMVVSSWESPGKTMLQLRYADQHDHHYQRHQQSYRQIHGYHHHHDHHHHLSQEHWTLLFTTGDHISQACRIIFLWQTNIFRSISSDHISLYVCGDRVYFSRKFINIVVSLMVRLKRRKWILAIYKVLFKQPVIHSSSNIYQPPLWIKWRRWWNKSTSKTEI